MRLIALIVTVLLPAMVFAGEREAKIYKTPSVAKKLVEKIDFCKDPLYQALFQRVEIMTELSKTKTSSAKESKLKAKDKMSVRPGPKQMLRLTAYDVICTGVW